MLLESARKILELDTTHLLLRYVSEWDPTGKGTTKGGYLEGSIKVPPIDEDKLYLEIKIVPTEDLVQEIKSAFPELNEDDSMMVALCHPGLLHNVMKGKGNKRLKELEPVPHHHSWKVKFLITNGEVRVINQQSNYDVDSTGKIRASVPLDPLDKNSIVTRLSGDNIIQLGKKDTMLNLIPLQPKQESTRLQEKEANVFGVLKDRLAHCGINDQQTLVKLEKFFKQKKGINLKKFRIRVDFYLDKDFQIPLIADTCDEIKDTGNIQQGSMDIYDVSLVKACCSGGRKIIMVSDFGLSKHVKPRFEVFDKENNILDTEWTGHLNQPDDFIVKTSTIHFLAPSQDFEIIKAIENRGLEIHLLMFRLSDNYKSPKTFKFKYIECVDCVCYFCNEMVDCDTEPKIPQDAPAIPGRKRRQIKLAIPPPNKRKILKAKKSDDQNQPEFSPTYAAPITPESIVSNRDDEDGESWSDILGLTPDTYIEHQHEDVLMSSPERENDEFDLVTLGDNSFQISDFQQIQQISVIRKRNTNVEILNTPTIDIDNSWSFETITTDGSKLNNDKNFDDTIISDKRQKDELTMRTKSSQNVQEKETNEEEEFKTLARIQWMCFMMMVLTMLITMATEVSTAQVMMLCTGFAAVVGIICHVRSKPQNKGY